MAVAAVANGGWPASWRAIVEYEPELKLMP